MTKTIYILIKPWDYTFAQVETYSTYDEAQAARKEGLRNGEKNSENWVIIAEDIAI